METGRRCSDLIWFDSIQMLVPEGNNRGQIEPQRACCGNGRNLFPLFCFVD